jgi:hypothetical protein
VVLAFPIIGGLVQWLHAGLTYAYPPFDNSSDVAMLVIATVCKLGTFFSIIAYALPPALARCYQNRAFSWRAFVVWCVAGLVLLGCTTAARQPLTTLTKTNSTLRFYYTHVPIAEHGERDEPGQSEFLKRWQSGVLIAEEAFTIVLAAGLLAACGYFFGMYPGASSVLACAGLLILLNVCSFAFQFLTWDYDTFFAATLLGPVALDILIFFSPLDPTAELGFIV